MNYTTNYQLPTWVETDRIQMDDFNDMTEKLDAALGEHETALTGCGNCKVYFAAYTGDSSTPGYPNLVFTFPKPPLVVAVFSEEGEFMIAARNLYRAHIANTNGIATQWEGNTVTFFPASSYIMNTPGRKYAVIAWMDMEE